MKLENMAEKLENKTEVRSRKVNLENKAKLKIMQKV